ncbi:hypothetical protein BC940DRAFT_332094 [Gongronella butleri]|nr:hypothetical protein BC940DRAFT_332094 [Gongronella butleri]
MTHYSIVKGQTQALQALLHRRQGDDFILTWEAPRASAMERGVPTKEAGRLLVLDASFNPPTRAHYGLLEEAWKQNRGEFDAGLLLFSTQNADKALSGASAVQRVQMMELMARHWPFELPVHVGVTTKARFVDKVAAIRTWWPGSVTFILGMDTVTRLFDAKYYDVPVPQALAPFFEHASLLCADRPGHADPAFWQQDAVRAYSAQMRRFQLPDTVAGLSSTLARQHIRENKPINTLLLPDIEALVIDQQLYLEK